jgi:hypothetical protein
LTLSFFHAERGLRKGCPLSPLHFLLIVKSLNRAIAKEKYHGDFHSIAISPNLNTNHLLFIDDVLILCTGQWCDVHKLYDILKLFIKDTCMNINERNSTLSTHNMEVE